MKLYFGPTTKYPVVQATDVQRYLSEDKKHQYQDSYSMAEASKSWVAAGGRLPVEVAALVGSNALDVAHFEYPTKVWGGGMAMTDVMAFIPNSVIAVEAKVDEPFDDIVSVWLKRNSCVPASLTNRQKTIERYASSLSVNVNDLLGIRYQLLQRTLSASIAARLKGVNDAWMIVQHFPRGSVGDQTTNRTDFDAFVSLVGDSPNIEGVRVQLRWASCPQAPLEQG